MVNLRSLGRASTSSSSIHATCVAPKVARGSARIEGYSWRLLPRLILFLRNTGSLRVNASVTAEKATLDMNTMKPLHDRILVQPLEEEKVSTEQTKSLIPNLIPGLTKSFH